MSFSGLSHVTLGTFPDTRSGAEAFISFRRLIHQKFRPVENAWLARDDHGEVAIWYIEGDPVAKIWAERVCSVSEATMEEVKVGMGTKGRTGP